MIEKIILRLLPEQAGDNRFLEKEVIRCWNRDRKEPVNDWKIVKRSIDARKKNVVLNLTVSVAYGEDQTVNANICPYEFVPVESDSRTIIIVGAGPAGLFAALKAIRLGIRPIVLERGRDVDARRLDIADISRRREINPVSNYCFGEGGAGAYSDGKLYTRSKKRGNADEVLQILVQHGAHEDILVDAHPHIGSDRLPHVIKRIRETIISCGGSVSFETKVEDLIVRDGRAVGVRIPGGVVEGDAVVLAIGHSAHDTFRRLHDAGVKMEPKGIAVGVRLEHPQRLIDMIQYHSADGKGRFLPPAEYNFVTQVEGRGVYSFCMCPGGVIVPAGSEHGELVVNGMSASARAGEKANSGMVVEVRPGDFPEFYKYGALEIMEFQESLEKRFFEEVGGIMAPAQRMLDFTRGKKSETLPSSTYAPGIYSADFHSLFPPFISRRLCEGFKDFGRKSKGFLTNEAALVGLESRTSSPVRIPRDKESLEHVEIKGLYPAGEGAGYAGGIISAAIDGIRCMEAIWRSFGNG